MTEHVSGQVYCADGTGVDCACPDCKTREALLSIAHELNQGLGVVAEGLFAIARALVDAHH